MISVQVTPENLEEVTDAYRNTLLPELEQQVSGYSVLLLLVNPDAGSAFEITLFDSEEARREGGMLERKLETLAAVLGEAPIAENFEPKLVSRPPVGFAPAPRPFSWGSPAPR